MKITATGAAVAAIIGMFGLTAALPVPAVAQDKAPVAAKKMSDKKMAKKAAPSKSVMAVQSALNQTGAKLKVDGFMGKRTRAAIKKYQATNGLKATGQADKATLAKLGV
jgi:peptidoglycan hydrolase-like protein with peptidoglycan-binding domain